MSEITTKTLTNSTVFPGVFGEGESFVEQMLKDLEKMGWSDRDTFAINLALVEGLTNAIRHGSKCDPSKMVHATYTVSPEQITMSVRDEGPGFNVAEVADPTDEANLNTASGRGCLLMRSFMNEVRYNDIGNELFMRKYPSPDPLPEEEEEPSYEEESDSDSVSGSVSDSSMGDSCLAANS
ncbi:MAG: ATP-binding protein [Planctomycetia bacterium]|nr:ATP-binding protein [Planctomycetia bacterium]